SSPPCTHREMSSRSSPPAAPPSNPSARSAPTSSSPKTAPTPAKSSPSTATAQLRSFGYRGAIIALTANAMKEDRDRCLQAGCDEYAAKPIDVPNLLRLMESLGAGNAATVKDTLVADTILRCLTQKFCDGTPAIIDNIQSPLRSHDLRALAAAAHQLAGAGGS